MGTLLPNRHPNRDFFILDVADAAPKDDLASMEHPVFSLSVKPDMRELEYEHNGRRLRVVPSGKGLATIMDKDILLYCISKMVHQKNSGEEITPWVEMSAHEVMVATNWRTNDASYQRFEEALIRLKGTVLLTDIATDGHTQTRGFGLIDEFEINRKNAKGELSPFLYQLVGGLRAGMGYCGTKTIEDLRTKTRFIMVSGASVQESHPHDIAITQEASNYSTEHSSGESF